MEIVKGTKGATLAFTVKDNAGPVDLTGSTVEVVVNVGGQSLGANVTGGTNTTYQATIKDAAAGLCEVQLGDIFTNDNSYMQIFVTTDNGTKVYPSLMQRVTIKDSLKG